ncbi:hypothetical protein GCM10011331_12480 [Flavimobilis marinus]|uniref:Putative ABC transport system permease protein n=1 Tax=Flavimobilis marinus TaxID=285351 RepID=A0A1I2G6W9_9MICO|nr:FtsX-like permease family protein [Flavimobilis marinus]GHG50127.1 hypothetical protein GCM10011331_12480 [Flavimobilis marinus]SFF12486.1 putative ABC transport system permease protein [Flavimobilis marinus]
MELNEDGSRWSAWRVAARLARRDAMRSKGRTALIAVLVALPVLVGAVAITLFASATPTQERQMNWVLGPSAQARVTWEGEAPLVQGLAIDAGRVGYYVPDERVADLSESLPVSVVEERILAALPPGSTLDPTWTVGVRVSGPATAREDIRAMEIRTDRVPGLVTLREGRLPESVDEAVVAAGVGIPVGSIVEVAPIAPVNVGIEPVQLHVVGVYDVPGAEAGLMAPPGAILDIDEVGARYWVDRPQRAWFVDGPPVVWRDVLALNEVGAHVVSRAVMENPPPAEQVGYHDWAEDELSYSTAALSIGGAVIAFGLFELVMLIGPAFAVGARRNERQLALVAAVGGDRRTLRRIVVLGGVVIGGAASVGAAAVGVGAAALVRMFLNAGYAYTIPEWDVPVGALLALAALGTGLAVAAAWAPARRAGRMDVVAALAQRRTLAGPRRRTSAAGVGLIAAGLAAAVAGAIFGVPALMVGGVVSGLAGMVMLSSGVLVLIARLAPWLGPAGRYAARDALRQHSRTAPALAAIIAAAAGVVAAGTYLETKDARDAAVHREAVGEGRIVVRATGDANPAVVTALEETLPLASLTEARTATYARETLTESELEAAGWDMLWLSVTSTPDPERLCPLHTDTDATPVDMAAHANDPRCAGDGANGDPTTMLPWSNGVPTIVDDGSLVAQLGLAGAADAARALREGRVLVRDPSQVWGDGHARLEVTLYDYLEDGGDDGRTAAAVTLPAAVTSLPIGAELVLPPEAARELGLTSEHAGYLGVPARPITYAEETQAREAVEALDAETWVEVERAYRSTSPYYYSLLLAAAVVVGAGATGIVLALSSAETRPDMATLGAIGAPPALRRRVAAAQAALVTVPGLVLGSVVGVAFAWVLVLTRQQESGGGSWPFAVPWLELGVMVVGVPLVVMGGAWLLTRSRLPMIRRLTD